MGLEVEPKKLIILINDEKLNEGKTNFTQFQIRYYSNIVNT